MLQGCFYYPDGDMFIHFMDGSNFINHSENPNGQLVYDEGKTAGR